MHRKYIEMFELQEEKNKNEKKEFNKTIIY